MPQPKSSRTAKPAGRRPAARKPAAAKDRSSGARAASPKAARRPASASARKPASASARKPASASARKPASASARKPASASARKPAATTRRAASSGRRPAAGRKPAAQAPAASGDEILRQNLLAVRDLLTDGVVLTAQRIQEALDDAVKRGRMTRRDAEDLAKGLLDAGRRQTQDLLADVEQLLGRSRTEVVSRASQSGDRVLREVDRVRRGAGVGPAFPILSYGELTAAQIVARLPDLKPAELRKVRDHERRGASRKSVLGAIDKRLR
jgi:polyhydroxyalkanoate synthesis regulator phasin